MTDAMPASTASQTAPDVPRVDVPQVCPVLDRFDAFRDQYVSRPAVELLDEILGCGFALRDVARMTWVPASLVRAWRTGTAIPSHIHGRQLATIPAFADLCGFAFASCADSSQYASWMETPLSFSPLRPLDLFVSGRHMVPHLYDLSCGVIDEEALLDCYESDWRDRYTSEWMAVRTDDGCGAIVRKPPLTA